MPEYDVAVTFNVRRAGGSIAEASRPSDSTSGSGAARPPCDRGPDHPRDGPQHDQHEPPPGAALALGGGP